MCEICTVKVSLPVLKSAFSAGFLALKKAQGGQSKLPMHINKNKISDNKMKNQTS